MKKSHLGTFRHLKSEVLVKHFKPPDVPFMIYR